MAFMLDDASSLQTTCTRIYKKTTALSDIDFLRGGASVHGHKRRGHSCIHIDLELDLIFYSFPSKKRTSRVV